MKEYLELLTSFFKVGILTFGGGYAMLPMLQREVVERRGWITEDEVLDCYAIGQCTPGVIAVNTATYVGYRRRGVPGAIAATVGIVLPSLIIITIIASVLRNFADYPAVVHAFAGIRVAVAALVVQAVVKLGRKGVKGALGIGIFAASLIVMTVFSISPVYIVAAAILIGVALAWKEGRGK